ncbi:MAG: HDOD domain-containing protein [Ignavibacteriaceae bacterium]|nr:HDOD domain-containing protein [Ignavibacterium sp.]MCC6256025.1 HDOD domain-containing protein [Ignavibacteriaceae bacterium]HMN22874.1 HDOD domain-containing protein [Ignavibacteriaceae bacterium]HRN25668.1 HDOD domain-containing protein [Ignavibacteriaceae bacterium]HRP91720.1 HDOD domain-containing protein [Ignavibacteriaceae bacterium]
MIADTQDILQKKERTEKVLTSVVNLPVIPKVMFETIKLLENKYTTAGELNKVISKDQALLTKILTIANSPLYGLQRKVTTIEYAILVLGYRELKNIISALSVAEAFRNKTDKYLNSKEFMLHSYLTGTACKKLATDIGFNNSGEAFIAGFLHDIGISIIHRYLHSSFINVTELVETKGMTFREAELDVLGMTHEQVGYFLLDRWNFPKEISDPILTHHSPDGTNSSPVLSAVVNLADYITNRLKLTSAPWDNDVALSPFAMQKFNLEREIDVERFIDSYKDIFWNQIEFVRFLS